jgi:hypothetical protein
MRVLSQPAEWKPIESLRRISLHSHGIALLHLLIGTVIQFYVQWENLASVILAPVTFGVLLYLSTVIAVEAYRRRVAVLPAFFWVVWFLGALREVALRWNELPYDAFDAMLRYGYLPTHDYLMNIFTPLVASLGLLLLEVAVRRLYDRIVK